MSQSRCSVPIHSYGADTCLELELKSVSFGAQAPGLNDSVSAKALAERH